MLVMPDRTITRNSPPWIIAEAGVNHNGDLEAAHLLLEMAARAGADAVKYQFFKAEQLVTQLAPQAFYQRRNTGRQQTQLEMLAALELPHSALQGLCDHAHELSLAIGITPFDEESLEAVAVSSADFVKVSSGDCNNYPFLHKVAAAGKPVIISTGMATGAEVLKAASELKQAQYAMLHCVSAYPAPEKEQNLLALKWMQQQLNCPVGYSDHTEGSNSACLAVALGAVVFEKHITLSRDAIGPDHRCSLEEQPFRRYVSAIRQTAHILGDGIKRPASCEADTCLVARRSITAVRDIEAGECIKEIDLRMKRPAGGLPPGELAQVVGLTARKRIPVDTQLTLEMLTAAESVLEAQ
jgi:N,N'-diacetyllegionaminate synthase